MSDLIRFLSLLDASSTNHLFATRPEARNRGLHPRDFRHHYGNVEKLGGALRRRNEQGFAVLVTVNEVDAAEPRNRKGTNIRRVRAVWQDDDKRWKGEFPLEPSLVIETSPGKFQRYWLVDGEWPTDKLARAEFFRVMVGMARNFGGDPNAKDLPRLLRVPGFLHVKGKPFQVRIVGGNERRYTREEIVAAFAIPPSEHRKPEPVDNPDWEKERSKVLDALEHIPADCDYDQWLTVGMALHWVTGGTDEGFDIWRGWSETAPSNKYPDQHESLEKHWRGFSIQKRNLKTVASLYALAKEHGWKGTQSKVAVEAEPLSELPVVNLPVNRSPDSLTTRTMQAVRNKFDEYGHHPSEDHYGGLEQVAAAIESMASGDGSLGDDLHVSFLPPGTGKTTVVVEAVRTLTQMDEYREAGVIIFLSRVEEIAKLAKEMNLSEDEYAVIVSPDYDEGNQGNPKKTAARVLFTTQQMLESRARMGRSFVAISDFHWNGRPRQVRVWDEAILPTTIHILDKYAIKHLGEACDRAGNKALTDAIEDFSEELRRIPDWAKVTVPQTDSHLSPEEMLAWMSSDADKQACDALFALSGKTVRVRKDQFGNSALGYENRLPSDLGPMLILDASGQQRKVYEFWHKERGGLKFLKSPPKDYSGLTIWHWDRGAGKEAQRKEWPQIVEEVVRTIEAVPEDEPVLVIHFKPGRRFPNLEDEIRARLNGSDNISFCTWGRHTATNEYAHIKHVIIVGVLQYSTSQIEAMARGAKGLRTGDYLAKSDFTGTRQGEVAHHVFQAACRGHIRKSERNGCPEGCDLYIIFSARRGTGIPRSLLTRIFPGAAIEDWRPLGQLNGRARELFELVKEKGATISKQELREMMGMSMPQFSKLLNHPDFEAAMNREFPGWEKEQYKLVIPRHLERGTTMLEPLPF